MEFGKAAMPLRDETAPRLIEWTGERCVPWAPDPQVVREHLHRYLWASALVRGRRVLDLASGEGFGAAILARTAESVLGVDLDPASVEHSRTGYSGANLSFAVADARELKDLPQHSFGAVVAFEMIEHVSEQERLLDQIRRVLEPGGLLIISTPDRAEYAKAPANPFHVRELGREEFDSLLGARFANVATFGQRAITGSALSSLADSPADPGTMETFFVERSGDVWRLADGIAPMYMVSLASDAELPRAARDSTLADCALEDVRWPAHAGVERPDSEEPAAHELERTRRVLAVREYELGRARDVLAERQRELERSLGVLAENDAELARQRRQLAILRARIANDADTIIALQTHVANTVAAYDAREAATTAALGARLHKATFRLQRMDESVTWQLFQRIRARVFDALGGADSRGVAALQSTLRFVGRRLQAGGTAPRLAPPAEAPSQRSEPAPICFTRYARPLVSIVMPLHAHAELTRAALESIRDCTPFPDYEVILVDDSEDAPTKALLETVQGARILVNDTNLGYLRSVGKGAALARGRWLVLCNNDIVVRRGWLDSMLECAESSADIAIVTPKYLAADGTVAEAGGIIWQDATGANYGRGEHQRSCHFEYRREVDYGSAAALLVRADLWSEVGGYDERFLPMYYEDADLCFTARARGLRVMYEPRAEVVHLEGSTAGTDETAGHKRHQALNRFRFQDKWRELLEREHLPNDPSRMWKAANLRRKRNVLVIDHVVPTWDQDAGSLRMREILRTLVELGCHVSFLPDNLVQAQPYTRELQRLGVEVLYGVDPRVALRAIGPTLSLAILSRPHVAARWLDVLREYAPDVMTVYDTVDLHWLREARQAAAVLGTDEPVLSPRALAIRELEHAMIRATDATVVVTETESARVSQDLPGTTLHVLPIGNHIRVTVPPVDARNGILFVGGFVHPPNVDAALLLAQEVMPLVWRELPGVKLTIAGAHPPPELQRLSSTLIEVPGWVEDLDPLLGSSRALVAPLRYGAGLKGKVTQALAEGLPVVTTPIGAEGLDAVDGEQILIGSGVAELAARTVTLLTDDSLWQRLSSAGQLLIADRSSPAVMSERLRELLSQCDESGLRRITTPSWMRIHSIGNGSSMRSG